MVHDIFDSEYGDFDLDGDVDASDFAILQANFGNSGGYGQGDADGDGMIDFKDFTIFQANYGWTR